MKLNIKLIPVLLCLIAINTTTQAKTTRIMPLGDSITYDDSLADHEGRSRPASKRTAYRNHLYYKLKDVAYSVNFVGSRVAGKSIKPSFDPDNEGHPGWTSYQIANNVYRFLTNNPADIVLLHIGTNDHDTSVAGVNDILDEIDLYEELTGRFVRVIVALIIDRQSQNDILIAGFNHHLNNLLKKRIAQGDAITMVDMYRGAGLTSADYRDHTHPKDAGYAKMANIWFDALMEPYNVSLHRFPTSVVSRSNIHSVVFDEPANKVTFIADIPDSDITF